VLDLNYEEHLHATVPSRDSDLLASSTDSLVAAWYVAQIIATQRSRISLTFCRTANISMPVHLHIPATTGLWRTQTSVELKKSFCLY
jgi:hypothetical protein